jgi:hypothetical protein
VAALSPGTGTLYRQYGTLNQHQRLTSNVTLSLTTQIELSDQLRLFDDGLEQVFMAFFSQIHI